MNPIPIKFVLRTIAEYLAQLRQDADPNEIRECFNVLEDALLDLDARISRLEQEKERER